MGVLHWASYGAGLAALLFITLSLGVYIVRVTYVSVAELTDDRRSEWTALHRRGHRRTLAAC